MKIAILDLTAQSSETFADLPRVGQLIEGWLSSALSEAEFTIYDIAHGGKLPSEAEFDGLLVSGSEKGVYEDIHWIPPLRELLVSTQKVGKPIFGICFGHQLMAETFGGKAEKSEAGYHVGARKFVEGEKTYEANVWHQDQVTELPPNSKVTSSAPYCPIGGLEYDFPALSVQYHPEYTADHLTQVIEKGGDLYMSSEMAQDALASLQSGNVSPDLDAENCAQFYRAHIGT